MAKQIKYKRGDTFLNGRLTIKNSEEYNTSYSLGFGGGIGVSIYFTNGLVFMQGKAYYRHMPPSKYNEWGFYSEWGFLADGHIHKLVGNVESSNAIFKVEMKYKGKEYNGSLLPIFVVGDANSDVEGVNKVYNGHYSAPYNEVHSIKKISEY